MKNLCLGTMLLVCATLGMAGQARAATATIAISRNTVYAGGTARLQANIFNSPRRCSLYAAHHLALRLVRTVNVRPGSSSVHLLWIWRVPSSARTATWRLSIYCMGNGYMHPVGTTLRVVGKGGASLTLLHNLRTYQRSTSPPLAPPMVTMTSEPSPSTSDTSVSVSFALSGGPVSSVTCTLNAVATDCSSDTATWDDLAQGSYAFNVSASGPGGSVAASAAWTVVAPPSPPQPADCTDPLNCSPINAPQMPPATQLFPLSQGECTDWADSRRPDIYYDQSASDANPTDWDAWTWGEHAQAEGLAVDTTPQVGDIAVWPISSGSPFGHVAYVESVDQSTLTVSEMNAPGDLTVEQTPDGYTYYESTWALSDLSAASVVYIHQTSAALSGGLAPVLAG